MNSHPAQARNARLGIRLFALYSLFYFGFVLVNAFAPQWSEWVIFPGFNLAVLWGFALIGLAMILALIYGLGCKNDLPADRSAHDQAARARGESP